MRWRGDIKRWRLEYILTCCDSIKAECMKGSARAARSIQMIKLLSLALMFSATVGTLLSPNMSNLASVAISESSSAIEAADPLSPGLYVIAESERMVMSAGRGREVVFETSDLEAAAGISAIEYITVTAIPPLSEGRLQIGSLAVAVGQSVSRINLSRLSFVPADADVNSSGFSFSVNGAAHSYTCTVNFSDKENTAPTLGEVSAAALTNATYSGMPVIGRMAAYDADGDELFFSISSFPTHGSVLITDRSAGKYVYIPRSGFSGRDSFSYIVRDDRGERAEGEATVNIKVERRAGRAGFADISGSVYESSAMRICESGVMGAKEIGGSLQFEPHTEVSRSDFIVMAMTAAGIDNLPECSATVFADDGDISAAARPYIDAAYKLGICDGWISDGKQCFLPNESIGVAEASVIVARILGAELDASASVWCAAVDDAPSWAAECFGKMRAVGIIGAGLADSARAKLDRLGCAELLLAITRV